MPPEDWWNSANNIFVLVTVVNDELIYGMDIFNWPNNYRRSPVFFTDCNILLTFEAIFMYSENITVMVFVALQASVPKTLFKIYG